VLVPALVDAEAVRAEDTGTHVAEPAADVQPDGQATQPAVASVPEFPGRSLKVPAAHPTH